MRVEETEMMHASRLVRDYVLEFHKTKDFFVYDPFSKNSWYQRLNWLTDHPVPHREQLVAGLTSYNRRIGNHPSAIENIDKLRSPDCFVIIGGQQAGLLTGPLYVIYKAITILKLAEKMSEELGKEIIPVFWIASEDHDFAEVNHTYVQGFDREIKRVQLPWFPAIKSSISRLRIPNEALKESVKTLFSCLPDSPFHKDLKESLMDLADQSDKLSDFFARIMAWLFGSKGLVLIDSADKFVRELEVPIMNKFLTEDYSSELRQTQRQLLSLGYHSQIDLLDSSVHLFIMENGERELLLRSSTGFTTKDGRREYSREYLIHLANREPEWFSANVVSRPVMQEYLFPVMGFVGGPGEVAYWAQLKSLFRNFDMQMPIVFPRMTFTIIERNIEKHMNQFGLTFHEAYGQWEERKNAWLQQQLGVDLDRNFNQFRSHFEEMYDSFAQVLIRHEPGVKNLAQSNRERILHHIGFLQQKTKEAMEHRFSAGLEQWKLIRQAIYPMEKPQERVYNVFGYLNQYGKGWLDDLVRLNVPFNASHKLLYI